ncbi:MAG: serpin family protein [Deltaproteobacteria bacterium]
MKRTLTAAAAVAVWTACGPKGGWRAPADPSRLTQPRTSPADESALVAGNTEFALALHRQLASQPGNLFYSPYSISLDLAEMNARGNADPSLASTLDFTLPAPRLDAAFDALDLDLTSIEGSTEAGQGYQFQEASAVWSALGVDPAWAATLAQYYGTQVLTGSDPGQALAGWQTSNSPDPLLPAPELIAACDLFLATFVNFDAAWQTAFDPAATRSGSFTRADGSGVTVPFMSQAVTLPVSNGVDEAVELPYDGGKLAMLVVVPQDLSTFEQSLDPSVLAGLLSGLAPQSVQLSLPKFSFRHGQDILPTLKAMGLTLGGGGEWEVFHAAEIQVSEQGTEAQASTVASHSPSAGPPALAIDRPFLFFILEPSTGTVLFIGRIEDPSASG